MSKPIVYLLEPIRMSIEDLHVHYDVRYIFDKHQGRSLSMDPGRTWSAVHEWAQANFDPEQHSFALTGQLTLVVLATLALQQAYPDHELKLLRYTFKTGDYQETKYGRHTPQSA